MRLKSLQMIGFKSFGDRTELVFDRQIVGVVGPNGCGKSNIVDAIRWAMGEQSAKGLRGNEMSDVIFNGASSRKKGSFAEVSLTFENADKAAPAPYTDCAEIMITRRLYRTGESEYLINKIVVRLKDITDLFLGTGSSARAYSIVAQGKVDQIVLAKPEDRRFLLEEAAGVAKYKARKQAAERKMEATRLNLERVHDITQELERSAKHLDRQVERAEQFRKIQSELRSLDEQVIGFKVTQLDQQAASNQDQRVDIQARFEGVSTQVSQVETSIEQFRLQALELEKSTSSDYQVLFQEKETFAQADKERELAIQRIQLLDHQINERKKDIDRLLSKAEANREASRQVLADREKLEETRKSASVDLEALKSEVQGSEQRIQALQGERTKIQSALEQIRTELARQQERRDMLQKERVQLEVERAGLEEEQDTNVSDQTEALSLLEQAREREAAALLTRVQTEQDLLNLQETRKNFLTQQAQLSDERSRTLQRVAQVEAELASLKTLEEHEVGYDSGALARKKQTGLPMVMDLVQFKAGSEAIGQAFLQSFGQFFADQGHDLDSETMDRVTWIRSSGDASPAIGTTLLDSVENLDTVTGPMRSLLGSIEVVTAIDATQSSRHPQIDKTGRMRWPISATVWTDSQGQVRKNESPFVRQAESRKLGEERIKFSELLTHLESQIRETKSALETAEREISKTQSAIQSVQNVWMNARGEVTKLESRVESLEARTLELKDEVSRLDERLTNLEAIIAELQAPSLASDALEVELTSLKDKHLAEIATKAQLDQRWIERRIAFGAIEERLDRLKQESIHSEMTQSEYAHNRSIYQADTDSWSQEIERERVKIVELEGLNASKRERIETLERTLNENREKLTVLRKDLEGVEVERKAVQLLKDKSQTEMQSLELEHQRLKFEVEELSQIVQERYHCSLADILAGITPDIIDRLSDQTVLRALEVDAKELRARLEKFGDVNLLALTEYQEIKQRLEFMNHQREDLLKTLDALQSIIDRINKITEFRFRETFKAINHNFQILFPKLFGGGRAYMSLTNENNLLETGVEIYAEPPGKRIQSMSLLSGGEKAMTSISLIFSLFAYRPSSFCILDEVDAPLDEVNTMRYNSIIKEMSALSQFIVITHNKKTMEVAETLFGVTMQEPGVSQLVGVQLGEARAFVASGTAA